MVDRCHEAGLAVRPWTVNPPEIMQEMLALGVDAKMCIRDSLTAGRNQAQHQFVVVEQRICPLSHAPRPPAGRHLYSL